MKKYWKIILPILFALAIALGFVQRTYNPFVTKTDPLRKGSSIQDSLEAYYQTAKDLVSPAPTSSSSSVTFLAVGDIMLSRSVATTINKANNPLLPFTGMADILTSTDFNFGNLESPFSGKNEFEPSGSLVFNVPLKNIQGLKDYNFPILNLANNHAFDQGLDGLLYTNAYLDQNNIKHIGTGKTLTEAWKPQYVEYHGIKIGFIGASFSSLNDNGKTINDNVARIEDITRLQSAVAEARLNADFVVVTMHAGIEYTRTPNDAQTAFAHAAVDAGADIVIGAHPHWVQTIEKYHNTYIFYSLGNFIFDQMWSQETREGLALKIQLSKNQPTHTLQGPQDSAHINQIELLPVIIENYSTPRLATPEESKKILQDIGQVETVLR